MERIHYAEGDTDSMFLSIAGDPNDDYHQAFKHVILNEKFYNENVYKWLPSTFYSTDNSNPSFESKLEQKKFDKKLGGFAIEKECECLVALAPKVYYFYNLGDEAKCIEKQYKVKGVCKRQNPLKPMDYINILKEKKILEGRNVNLQL
jgi:hypothetical protein